MNPRLRLVRTDLESSSSTAGNQRDSKALFAPNVRPPSVLSKRAATPSAPVAHEPPSLTAAAAVETPQRDEEETEKHNAPSFTVAWSPLPRDLDLRIIEAICGSSADGRSAYAIFREKEQQVAAIFAALSLSQAQALHRRLTLPASDDPVVAAFARLTRERRDRLVQFLADARRRAAQARPRR